MKEKKTMKAIHTTLGGTKTEYDNVDFLVPTDSFVILRRKHENDRENFFGPQIVGILYLQPGESVVLQ